MKTIKVVTPEASFEIEAADAEKRAIELAVETSGIAVIFN